MLNVLEKIIDAQNIVKGLRINLHFLSFSSFIDGIINDSKFKRVSFNKLYYCLSIPNMNKGSSFIYY